MVLPRAGQALKGIKSFRTMGVTAASASIGAGERLQQPAPEKRVRIQFTKLGAARFLSHLELSAALIRAIHQSGLNFVYSEGFHPHPKISFAFATAVGMESMEEYADIQIKNDLSGNTMIHRINAFLPEGMEIKGLREISLRQPSLSEEICGFQYDLRLPDAADPDRDGVIQAKLDQFLASETFTISREVKEKRVVKDIRPLVLDVRLDQDERRIELRVACEPAGMVRPMDILTKVCAFDEETARSVRIIKRETYFY